MNLSLIPSKQERINKEEITQGRPRKSQQKTKGVQNQTTETPIAKYSHTLSSIQTRVATSK